LKRKFDPATNTSDRRLSTIHATLLALKRRLLPFRSRNSWAETLEACFGAASEAELATHHPPHARVDEFRSIDPGSTELEVLELLHAIVRVFKPLTVLETGTFRGFGTLTLAHALACNGKGTVKTVDRDSEAVRLAKRHIRVFDPGLLGRVSFIRGDSLETIATLESGEVGLAFLDSAPSIRVAELELLLERQLLAPAGIVVIHDTNFSFPAPEEGDPEMRWQGLARLEALTQQHGTIWSPLSRGFMMMQLKATDRAS
jgi:predicted O-methyltransferase YrrM